MFPWRKSAPEPALTAQEREAIEARPTCEICAGRHAYLCPYVEEEEFYETGKLKRRVLRDRGALIDDIVYLD